jgi:DNA modification methylase
MDDESVHMGVTSSPYYGLRNYGTEPVVWDDGWKGELGQEPTPEMFVKHLTTIFHELKRVLRNDGIFWMNLGDSYASGKGTCNNPGGGEDSIETKSGRKDDVVYQLDRGNISDLRAQGLKPKDMIGIPWRVAFALQADGWYLRADIPWLKRSSMPSSVTDRPGSSIEHVFLFSKSGDTKFWTHPTKCGTHNQPEPDYVYTNRATGEITQSPPQDWKEIMYVKEGETKKSNLWKRRNLWDGHDYFYDHIATMQQSSESYNKDKRPRGVIRQCVNKNSKYPSEGQFKKQDGTGNETYTGFNARYEPNGFGLRYMRDSDFFFKTWQGILHNEDGEPMALVVNPKGYKGSHFASFPPRLIEPLILAGSSDRGVCPKCGAPWVRITTKGEFINQSWGGEHVKGQEAVGGVGETSCLKTGGTYETITVDWKPTCTCDLDPIPATVIDPFSGSSATGVACKLHNRTYIGIELNPEYVKLGEKRIKEGK